MCKATLQACARDLQLMASMLLDLADEGGVHQDLADIMVLPDPTPAVLPREAYDEIIHMDAKYNYDTLYAMALHSARQGKRVLIKYGDDNPIADILLTKENINEVRVPRP
jgi:hypothetical protein